MSRRGGKARLIVSLSAVRSFSPRHPAQGKSIAKANLRSFLIACRLLSARLSICFALSLRPLLLQQVHCNALEISVQLRIYCFGNEWGNGKKAREEKSLITLLN
jgi:hypothetical protein